MIPTSSGRSPLRDATLAVALLEERDLVKEGR
jgi:hypothetical protein